MYAGARVGGSATRQLRPDDADFRRAVDEAKSAVIISGVIGRAVKLKRSGKEWKGLCPFHTERTPSFTVVDAHERAYCFGCGWQGDVFRFVMDMQRCSFREAFRIVSSGDLPQWTPIERAKAQAEDRLERLADEELARRWFKEAVPISGTPGETYLRARGISLSPPDTVRFSHVPSWRNPETGEWGRKRPAIICGAQDVSGAVVGIQRIFFVHDSPSLGKADCKLSFGSVRGHALRLGPVEETIVLAEGPEDGLSIAQEGPGFPVWVPFGTGNMPAVEFPPQVRSLIIAGQNNTAGRVAVEKTVIAALDRGLAVSQVYPAAHFDDWNDQLRGLQ